MPQMATRDHVIYECQSINMLKNKSDSNILKRRVMGYKIIYLWRRGKQMLFNIFLKSLLLAQICQVFSFPSEDR